jgi:type IV secretion system protein VirB9
MLERDEKIEIPVVGLSSDCKSENDEWCISAIVGSNQIFVRPRDNASRNNMELHTNKRDYSFAFQVVDDSKGSRGKRADSDVAFFRVVFDYPRPKPLTENMSGADRAAAVDALLQRVDMSAARPIPQQVDPDYGMTPAQRLKAEGIQIRNTNYSKQVLERGEDAEPTMVFDDGRFTYFEFPGAREIPAVFAHGSDGEPTRVNWHMNGNFVVVQRTARKFTLRLGDAVVGIFNEAFDRTGIETPTSTVSPAVVREIKGAAQ